METTREKFNILANYSSLRPFICLCSKGLLHRMFQVEVFGKGNEQVFGFGPVKNFFNQDFQLSVAECLKKIVWVNVFLARLVERFFLFCGKKGVEKNGQADNAHVRQNFL